MQGLLNYIISTMLFKSTNGQLLYDVLKEQQKCVNLATHMTTHIIKNELDKLTKISKYGRNKNPDANNRNMKTDFLKLLLKEAIDNSTNAFGNKLTCSGGRIPTLVMHYTLIYN